MQLDRNGNTVNDCIYKIYGANRKKIKRDLAEVNFFIKIFWQYNYVGTEHKSESNAIIKRMNIIKEELEQKLSELK